MARTAIGIFENQGLANQVAGEIKVAGVSSTEIHVLTDPIDLPVEGSLSSPHTDFMAALCRELREMGATDDEANAYVRSIENGSALVMATGSAEQVSAAASIMNQHHAADVEQLAGLEPALPATHHSSTLPRRETVSAGRIRQSGGGARIFVW